MIEYAVLMILFLILWATALGIVYFKIKRSGMTAPKKRIFVSHIVLVLVMLGLNLAKNLVAKRSIYW